MKHNTTIMQRPMSIMGMRLNWKTVRTTPEELEWIGWIDFLNLSKEDVLRFNFADVDIAFEFYQQYAKYHGFGARRSRNEKRGEVRIRQEFVCHRQGYRSSKFYSMPNRQKRPRAETRCGCPARMLLRMDDESGRCVLFRRA
ncbi:hypothetical protein Ahy_B10g103067 isoform C [Arachis hypogaea]|uniref:FAR1 domain-containing protein n=1 Tax=Arachis hypogaea TaxID=3818 RepID=A0A444X378_ARAHY|nr:hypothetical protein Ahy_B10g103067 isoform C [Arachis hypogaea]